MILRRLIARAVAAPALLSAAAGAPAEPMPADRLPSRLLADCDARAAPPGGYEPPIAAAVTSLTDLGVFTPMELRDARIGFCGLKRAGGPVATTSCEDGVILLDLKYTAVDQALVLRTTLAHEAMHHLQHREAKARHGEAYCDSAHYRKDKPSLEADADAFGDKVAALFALGRGVEIVNACDAPVWIYLEADDPVAVRGVQPAFLHVPARGAAMAPERALSGRFLFYAQTAPSEGRVRVWRNRTSAETRIVEGRLVRLRRTRLAAQDRVDGPFRLRLTCQSAR